MKPLKYSYFIILVLGSILNVFVLVVDCPSEEYLDSLLSNETFKKHQSTATNDEDFAALVVHFTPKDILEHPR